MKATKIIYWTTTAIVSGMMLLAAWMYLTSDQVKQAFQHLGFPSYFRIELAIAKIVGAVVLLVPYKARIKEWSYAGLAIVFVSVIIAHAASGDPASVIANPVVFLVLLLLSYGAYLRMEFSARHSTKKFSFG